MPMGTKQLRAWSWTHQWSSLICTVFMLLLCVTGLPLIFHHEIGHLLGTEVQAPKMPEGTPLASLDRVLDAARAANPQKKVPLYLFGEPDDPSFLYVSLGDTPTDQDGVAVQAIDARTAEPLKTPKFDEGFMYVMFKLHVDLFAGLPGKLFLGFMGLLLLVAIVTGVVLYAPFMRKLVFGEVRRDRSSRLKWLDLHNLLGIVTLTWLFVVGATGMINTWADLIIKYWQHTEVSALLAPYQNQRAPTTLASLQAAVSEAQKIEPGRRMSFVAFPGTPFSSPHHYAVMLRGDTPLTARLIKPVLVDAGTGHVTASVDLPWYLTALLVSQPLHFGDYGGMGLQVVWAVLDVISIIVLGSGLYLWFARRSARKRHEARDEIMDEAVLLPERGTGPVPVAARTATAPAASPAAAGDARAVLR